MKDAQRTWANVAIGYQIWNGEVFESIEGVLEQIGAELSR